MKKIGYLGPPGTYTEAAAIRYAGGGKAALVCCRSLAFIISAVESGELDEGVVPLENSTEGAVSQVLDLVAQSPVIMFRGEVILNIRHSLLVRPGTPLNQVVRVLSHPQALAQCRDYLSSALPEAETEETSSTAQAASIVAGSGQPWAAVGTDLAAKNYNLEIAVADIQDSSENATRFIVLAKQDDGSCEICRTSIIVVAKDRPGALYSILREFALRDINLTRIESRPVKKKLGQYMFFIDLAGSHSNPKVSEAIEAIEENTSFLRILGSYPRDKSAAAGDREAFPRDITLEEARSEIDLVDSQIVELIGIRTKLVDKIGALKKDPGTVRDAAREEEVLRRVRAVADLKGAEPDMIENIYRYMISQYVEMQKVKIKKEIASH
ncbi:MAG: prephenate dehydratase [Desulfocucumaceae bacterium]